MLKSELMAPAAVAADEQPQSEQLAAKVSMALKAAAALQASITALGPGLLDQQVLNDVALEDLMQYLGLVDPPWAPAAAADSSGGCFANSSTSSVRGAPQNTWHLPPRAQKRLACIASCVAAVRLGRCIASCCMSCAWHCAVCHPQSGGLGGCTLVRDDTTSPIDLHARSWDLEGIILTHAWT